MLNFLSAIKNKWFPSLPSKKRKGRMYTTIRINGKMLPGYYIDTDIECRSVFVPDDEIELWRIPWENKSQPQ